MVEFLQALLDDMEVEDSAYGPRVVPQFMPIPGEEAQEEVRPTIVFSDLTTSTVQISVDMRLSVTLSGGEWR